MLGGKSSRHLQKLGCLSRQKITQCKFLFAGEGLLGFSISAHDNVCIQQIRGHHRADLEAPVVGEMQAFGGGGNQGTGSIIN